MWRMFMFPIVVCRYAVMSSQELVAHIVSCISSEITATWIGWVEYMPKTMLKGCFLVAGWGFRPFTRQGYMETD